MNRHKKRCHCGAIRFKFIGPEIDGGSSCNCSIVAFRRVFEENTNLM